MRIGLEIGVFCVNDGDILTQDLGLEINLSDCILERYVFYNVEYIVSYRKDRRFSMLGSCGDDFIVNMNIDELQHTIEQLGVLRFN